MAAEQPAKKREMTPAERRLRARLAANARWAKTDDRAAATQAARDGLTAKFEREVDPDGALDPRERARRVENARAAHMNRMRLARSRKTA